jgi:hypothetical protein
MNQLDLVSRWCILAISNICNTDLFRIKADGAHWKCGLVLFDLSCRGAS